MSSQHQTPKLYTMESLFRVTKRVITDLVNNEKDIKTVLDLPSGGGALAYYLKNQLGLSVVAADIDPNKFDASVCPFFKVDLNQVLPFGDNSFDLVVCMEGLKHVSYLELAIKELARVTKKGCYLIVTIPNDLCMEARLSYFFDGFVDLEWKRALPPNHPDVTNYLYIKSLISLPYLYFYFEQNGLRLLKTETSHYRFWSLLLALLLYPILIIAVWRRVSVHHPLFREMISLVWLAGKRNVLVLKKN
ncbi:MAG: class I SAM-dependent methyltransferase [Bdellovibrionaceae bacterium]|nr:class I SAM-dependent methyltransferase [Pseudobdellovibrionaceae bacterium]MDW8190624.1 methyltransferase domain-containing protein [Pseudobdellovibrionaceae bacterium]